MVKQTAQRWKTKRMYWIEIRRHILTRLATHIYYKPIKSRTKKYSKTRRLCEEDGRENKKKMNAPKTFQQVRKPNVLGRKRKLTQRNKNQERQRKSGIIKKTSDGVSSSVFLLRTRNDFFPFSAWKSLCTWWYVAGRGSWATRRVEGSTTSAYSWSAAVMP